MRDRLSTDFRHWWCCGLGRWAITILLLNPPHDGYMILIFRLLLIFQSEHTLRTSLSVVQNHVCVFMNRKSFSMPFALLINSVKQPHWEHYSSVVFLIQFTVRNSTVQVPLGHRE